jgi:hypothetical protein
VPTPVVPQWLSGGWHSWRNWHRAPSTGVVMLFELGKAAAHAL